MLSSAEFSVGFFDDAPNSELKFWVSGIELDTLELFYLPDSITFETFENLFAGPDLLRSPGPNCAPLGLGWLSSVLSWLEEIFLPMGGAMLDF